MKIDEYLKKYSRGDRIRFRSVLEEFGEFLWAVLKLSRKEMIEEFRDVCVHLQAWLYFRFGINGETWKINMRAAVEKYDARQEVWREIYVFAELDENISGYSGNYIKVEKVVGHLGRFGISEKKAREAHRKIVLKD